MSSSQPCNSRRASPGVRTEWDVFQVGSPPRRALLEFLPDTPGGKRYIRLLYTISHPNVLLIEGNAGPPFVDNGQKLYPIFIPYVEGTLYDICGPESSCLIEIGSLLPSSLLVRIARDIIEGLSYMHLRGEYHGNISVRTTFYCRDGNGEISVRLANFGFKDIPLKEAQSNDWRDFGKMLLEIEQEISAYNCCHTSVLLDFANLLINSTGEDSKGYHYHYQRHGLEAHAFFSDTYDRQKFLCISVPKVLRKPHFCKSLRENSSKICRLPWGCADYYALLPAVNHCRNMDFEQVLYEERDFTDVVKFVGFVCDLYEYCGAIEKPEGGTEYTDAQMDELIISKHPLLHHELKKLVMEATTAQEN